MNHSTKLTVALLVLVLFVAPLPDAYAEKPENWRLGMQAYSFNRFTFYEAVDKTRALGLRYIEAYPGQRLSKEKPNVKTNHNMSSEDKTEMLQKLREAGVKLVNYGVVGLPNNKDECRKVFMFARDMGIGTIVSEPPEDAFGLIDKLCEEFKINVAIHNHPKPSRYWNPDTVLKVCKPLRSGRVGACADTGHWLRSGVNPVEALKKLEGHIISLHFKDLDQGHDVIWGTGKCDVKAMLTELARQKFKGVFSIEYEHNWLNSMPDIAECVPYFERTAAELGVSDWKRIFNGKDMNNWLLKGAKDNKDKGEWVVGTAAMSSDDPKQLVCEEGGRAMINLVGSHGQSLDIYSKEKFGDCRIELEVMVPKGSNSGIYVMGEYEIQVLDSWERVKLGSGDMGAIYGASPPTVNACRKPGQWQKYVIDFKAPRFNSSGQKVKDAEFVKVELNGQVLHENVKMTKGSTGSALVGKEAPTGPLMFQGNHGPVAYRNIIVKPLKK